MQLDDGSRGLRRREISVRDFCPSVCAGRLVRRIFRLGLIERAFHIARRDRFVPIDGFAVGALPQDSRDHAPARRRDVFNPAQREEAIMPAPGDRNCFHPITVESFAVIGDDEESALAVFSAFRYVIELRPNLVTRRGRAPAVRSGVFAVGRREDMERRDQYRRKENPVEFAHIVSSEQGRANWQFARYYRKTARKESRQTASLPYRRAAIFNGSWRRNAT